MRNDTRGACSPAGQNQAHINCFLADGSTYVGATDPEFSGNIQSGVEPATTRLLLSYERLLLRRLGVLFRGGIAFGGGPTPSGGSPFMPVHAEVDGRYYIAGKDGGPLDAFLFLGTGIAQVDSDVTIDVLDCPPDSCLSSGAGGLKKTVRANTVYGLMFVTAGIGATWMFDSSVGIFGRLGAMAMFPATGFVVEPSVGLTAGL